jgi:hypothetical protein
METSTTFRARVDELDARLREKLPAIAPDIRREETAEHSVTWRYGRAWGTLVLHEIDEPQRLSLLLYHVGGTDEQDVVEVNIDEADVIDVLADPLAGLFEGRVA